MAITLNTYSNFGNKPITIQISGITPNNLILAGDGVTISYEDKQINETLTDWKGTLTFLGTPDTFKQFGMITNNSHKVTITYSNNRKWVGRISNEIYDVPYTGFDEKFQLNIVSSLNIIKEKQFNEITNLYSIQNLLDIIKSYTELDNIFVNKSFTQSLNDIKINSNNFLNDDGDSETYSTILEWICTSFGFKAIVNDNNELIISSYELLYNNSNVWSDANHMDINETYSVSEYYNSGRVIANNYQMSPISADFDITGNDNLVWGIMGQAYQKTYWVTGSMMTDPYPSLPSSSQKHPYSLEYNRGRGALISKDGNWITYDRSLYQYGDGKQWKFNKYSSAGVLVNEYSASLSNNTPNLIAYMDANGNLLPGAYPIAYRAYGSDDKTLPDYERTTILKLNYTNTNTVLDATSAKNMIYWKREGIQFPDQQYLFFDMEYSNGAYWGAINGNSDPQWTTTTNRNARGNGNMDLCPINLVNDYAPNTRNTGRICLTAKITTLDNTVLYWSWNADYNPSWRPDNGNQWTTQLYREREDQTGCYEFKRILDMVRPTRNGVKVPLWKEKYGYWVELPTTYCNLEIMIGVVYNSTLTAPMAVILRNFNVEQVGRMEVFGEVNDAFERKDTIYSTDIMTDNNFPDVTFNLCSENEYNGLAGLFYITDFDRLDTLTYPIGNEKIEQHYLRLMTKLFSNYEVYNDAIMLDNLKFNYSDRWFNGGEINLVNGTLNGVFISHNNNLTGNI